MRGGLEHATNVCARVVRVRPSVVSVRRRVSSLACAGRRAVAGGGASIEHQINLFRLIAGQVSEGVIEGEAWLYALPPEVMSVSEEDRTDGSTSVVPVYQGQFRLTRLSYP